MATTAITTTPQPVTAPAGSPATASAACTIGLSAASAASGPTVTGNFTWPSLPAGQNQAEAGQVTLYVVTATTANLITLS